MNIPKKIIYIKNRTRQQLYETAIKHLKQDELSLSQEILVQLIDTFEFKKDVQIFSFSNVFESLLYLKQSGKNQKVVNSQEPISDYFYHLAVIMFELKDYHKSLEFLREALKYNPVMADALYLQSEIFLLIGNKELSYKKTIEALELCYTKKALAKGYYQLAKAFFEKGNKEMTIALLLVVDHYDSNLEIRESMMKAENLPGPRPTITEPSELRDIFHRHQIQFGPHQKVITTINNFSIEAIKMGKNKFAEYLINIGYQLTDSDYYQNLKSKLKA